MSVSKVTFRKKCLKRLRGVAQQNRSYRDGWINRRLQAHPKLRSADAILGFWPMGMEPDIRATLGRFRRSKKVYLPFMEDDSFKMVPFRLPLRPKRFGIYEPGNTNRKIKKIDVAIVPAVGVDGEGRRVGFGKGMYDRFFARLHQKPYIIFVQRELCKTTNYICDDYDVKADQLITPFVHYSVMKGTNNDKRNTLRRSHSHT